jgi:hypothetical protein
MKNVKKVVLSLLLGSACIFGGQAKAMLTTDEVREFLGRMPATFDPNAATLEDFSGNDRIKRYKLTEITPGTNSTPVLNRVQFRGSLSTVQKCVFNIHYATISDMVGGIHYMELVFTLDPDEL